MSWLIAIRGFLGKVPWQLYVAVAAVLLLFGTYHKGVHDGKQVILDRLEKAEAEATKKAVEAADKADDAQAEEADKFEAEQDALRKVIDEAEAEGGNALDAIFGN